MKSEMFLPSIISGMASYFHSSFASRYSSGEAKYVNQRIRVSHQMRDTLEVWAVVCAELSCKINLKPV